MKIIELHKFIKLHNLKISLINRYYQKRNQLFFRVYNKKKIKLRNSFKSDSFYHDNFNISLNFKRLRESFFNRNLFAYSNSSEKEKIMEYLNENCSSIIKKYIECANKILEKEFSIFEKKYKFKNKINWNYSFFKDFNWNLEQSEKINIRPRKNIDVKYVWELNRHQHLPYLGFAYYITKNKKYAIEFKNQILHWIKNNPPLYGINWYSGLEISIRLISWIFSLYFFKDSKEINNNKFFKKIFNSLFEHAYYLKYFYTIRSFNHTVGELFGLYLFCKNFDNLKPIKKWEKKTFRKIKSQIFLQTRPDGTNIEQSVNYHVFVLEFITLFYILDHKKLTKNEYEIIEKMYDFLIYIIKPDGNLPLIGDVDDGKVILLTFYNKNSYIELLNLGTILFQREDYKYFSKELYPSTILILGTKGYNIYTKLKRKPPITKIKYFENAGYISIRNNWTKNANYLFVDFGRFGGQNAPHTHSGITNFIFSYKGKNILNDSGSYSYNKSWKERNLYRSSKAHNILTINSKNQAIINGWFSWINKPRIKRRIKINDNNIELSCIHNGFKEFFVKRKIITNRDLNSIIIEDKVISSQKNSKRDLKNIDINFHFDKNIKLIPLNHSILINNGLNMEFLSDHDFIIRYEKFFYSPGYGFKNESPMVNIHLEESFVKKNLIKFTTRILKKEKLQKTNV